MQSKVIEYTKTYETIKSHDKKPSMKANDKVTYVLELSGKDIKAATTKFLERRAANIYWKKYLKWKVSANGDMKKNQMDILDMYYTISEMKIITEWSQ